jgi:Lon-like ATP-dependent protease
VDSQQPDVKPTDELLPADEVLSTTKPASESDATNAEGKTLVTTTPRAPLKIPSTVSVRVTQENLRDYVGPPIYHKDRLYTSAPPAGVSTGLGYLGNGSGAVMPIEVTVS